MSNKKPIGELFKEALDKKGISQSEAAKKLGVSEPTLSQFISGRKSPTQKTIIEYCKKLNIEYIQILKVK